MFKLIFSALGLTVAFCVFFMYTQPTYQMVQAKKVLISQYDEALNKAAELQQLKQSLLSRYNAFNPADLSRLQKLLPDHDGCYVSDLHTVSREPRVKLAHRRSGLSFPSAGG